MADIDVLVLDCDGVVRHWDSDHFLRTAEQFGLTSEDLAAIAFEPQLLAAAMTGVLTAEAWNIEIGRRASAAHGVDAAALAEAFASLGWMIDGDVLAIVHDVRATGRARVALFSNASTRLERDLEASGIDTAFDVVFNSARLGVAKPDPAAFRIVADTLGIWPERILFVDDQAANVDGARRAGMQAEQFTGATRLRSLLEKAGLL